jgi:hypothetical protein
MNFNNILFATEVKEIFESVPDLPSQTTNPKIFFSPGGRENRFCKG